MRRWILVGLLAVALAVMAVMYGRERARARRLYEVEEDKRVFCADWWLDDLAWKDAFSPEEWKQIRASKRLGRLEEARYLFVIGWFNYCHSGPAHAEERRRFQKEAEDAPFGHPLVLPDRPHAAEAPPGDSP